MRLIGAVLRARARARHQRQAARRRAQPPTMVRVLVAPFDWSREPDL